MPDIPSSSFVPEDPGGTFPNTLGATAVIPGSNVIETTGLRQHTLPAPPVGTMDWRDKISQILLLAGAGIGDVYRPPGMKTGAVLKEVEQMQALRDEKAARQALGYIARLQAFAMNDPTRAQDAMLDLSDFLTANAEHIPTPVLARGQQAFDYLRGLDAQEKQRQAFQALTAATSVLSDPTSPQVSKLGAAQQLMAILGPEKAAQMFPQILQMAGLVQERAPKAYQAAKGERGELLTFDPNTGKYVVKREAEPVPKAYQPVRGERGELLIFDPKTGEYTPKRGAEPRPFDPKTETGKIVADIKGLMDQGVPSDSPIIGNLARQLERVGKGGMESPLGKALTDQKAIIAEYGKDSLQAKAFGEYIQKQVGAEPPSLSDIGGIRREFTAQSKDFIEIRGAYKRILSVGKSSTPAANLALIYSYMRMLDPGGRVTEQDYASASNAAGVPERIHLLWNRMKDGLLLTDSMRADYLARSHALFESHRGSQIALESEYKRIATQSKVDPTLVTPDFIGDLRSFDAQDLGTSTEDAVRTLKRGLGR